MPHRMYVQVDPITRRYAHMPLGTVDTGVDLSRLSTESRKGIDYLTDASVATVSAALSFLDISNKLESPVSAVFSLAPAAPGSNGSARVFDDMSKAGFAVIVSKGKAIPTVIVTKNPAVVVDSARSGGAGAVFRIPAGLADASASALLATIPNPNFPVPGKKPSLWPALAIGGVAVALVVGVLAMKPGAKTGMKPNRRRRALRRNTGKDPQYTLVQLKNDPMIRMVVGNYHVGTPDGEIERYFRERCAKAGYSKSFADKMVKAALFHHHKNRALYSHVMGGMKSRSHKLNSNPGGIYSKSKRSLSRNGLPVVTRMERGLGLGMEAGLSTKEIDVYRKPPFHWTSTTKYVFLTKTPTNNKEEIVGKTVHADGRVTEEKTTFARFHDNGTLPMWQEENNPLGVTWRYLTDDWDNYHPYRIP